MLGQLNMQGKDRVQVAIDRIRQFEPEDGYYLAFSGGKDSVVIKRLADMAGVKYDAHYNITTVDPPELVKFIKQKHPDVIRDRPETNMWDLIVQEGIPPTRRIRYCCEYFKEREALGRVSLMGIRWAESASRKNGWIPVHPRTGNKDQDRVDGIAIFNTDNDIRRKMIEQCLLKGTVTVNPIIDWSFEDVWKFIRAENIPYCSLYDDGFSRLGCIGCPNAGDGRWEQFNRWPHYFKLYLKAFERMADKREKSGKENDKDALGWMAWWMQCEIDDPRLRKLEERSLL